jgi:hypothetical protein
MTLTPEVQAMLDRESIRTVVLKVSRAMDRADEKLFRSCYHEDAWDDHGYYKGPIADFKPTSIFRPAHIKNVSHLVGNILIELEGTQAAWCESYYVGFMRSMQDNVEKDSCFGGRYVDRFERRNGEWKIARRTTLYDWTRVDPVGQTLAFAGSVLGKVWPEDFSYEGRA